MGYGRRLLRALLGASLVTTTLMVGLTTATAAGQCVAAPDPDPATDPARIMIAGDSITTMSSGDFTWRYFFDQQLRGRVNADLVGRFDSTFDNNTYATGQHEYASCDPDPTADPAFTRPWDWDNESRSGAHFVDDENKGRPSFNAPAGASGDPEAPSYPGFPSWISGAVSTWTPDYVIGFLGGNDLVHYKNKYPNATEAATAAAVVQRAHDFVEFIQVASPDTDILMIGVNGGVGASSRYGLYNNALLDQAPTWSVAGHSTVTAIVPPDWTTHTWDGWHPDARGDALIGRAVMAAMHTMAPAVFPAALAAADPPLGPRFPTTLATPQQSGAAYQLSWDLPAGANVSYVQRNEPAAGPGWTTLARVGQGCNPLSLVPIETYTDSNGLYAGHTYRYRVIPGKAGLDIQSSVCSSLYSYVPFESVAEPDRYSNIREITASNAFPPPPPPKPARVAVPGVTALEHAVKVTWAPVADATGYQLRWRRSGAVWSAPVSVGATTTRTVSGLTPGLVYEFSVRALREGAPDGDYSEPKTSGVRAYKLASPARPRLAALAKHKIRATWTPVAKANRYLVQVRLGTRLVKSVFVTRTTWTSGVLKKRKTYKVTVRPYDGAYGGGTSAAGSIKAK